MYAYPPCTQSGAVSRPSSANTGSREQLLVKIWESHIQMIWKSALHLLGLSAESQPSLTRIRQTVVEINKEYSGCTYSDFLSHCRYLQCIIGVTKKKEVQKYRAVHHNRKGIKMQPVFVWLYGVLVPSHTTVSFRFCWSVMHCMLEEDLVMGQSRVRKCLLKVSERQA